MDTYGDKIRLVFRDYPLPFHDNAHIASEAAQCAHEQDRFWEYHDKLFQNQQGLQKEKLKQYAGKLGADTSRWHFLTGPAETIARLVDKDGFKLGSGEYIINHSTHFVLVDRSGKIRGFYEGTEAARVVDLARDINRLLAE